MTLSMYHGEDGCCGAMSTGGTESIMLAVYAYRNHAREELGIKKPEMCVRVSVRDRDKRTRNPDKRTKKPDSWTGMAATDRKARFEFQL